MRAFQKALPFIALILLASCGGGDKPVRPRVSTAALAAPQGMTYEQYRDYADRRAKDAGGEEHAQRRSESADGNYALHKRFVALDRNNDGRLSDLELGGL